MAGDVGREVGGVPEVVTGDATTTSLQRTEVPAESTRLDGCGPNKEKNLLWGILSLSTNLILDISIQAIGTIGVAKIGEAIGLSLIHI